MGENSQIPSKNFLTKTENAGTRWGEKTGKKHKNLYLSVWYCSSRLCGFFIFTIFHISSIEVPGSVYTRTGKTLVWQYINTHQNFCFLKIYSACQKISPDYRIFIYWWSEDLKTAVSYSSHYSCWKTTTCHVENWRTALPIVRSCSWEITVTNVAYKHLPNPSEEEEGKLTSQPELIDDSRLNKNLHLL